MIISDWELIRQLLGVKLGIPEKILDYIAVRDILVLCTSGGSNETICRFLKLGDTYVSNVIHEYLDFDGWVSDLDYNPKALYELCKGDIIDYNNEVYKTTKRSYPVEFVTYTFARVSIFSKLEEELEIYWK